MGKGIRAGEKKPNAEGQIVFKTKGDFKRYLANFSHEATQKAMLIFMGYLMDEPEFNFSEERFAQMWEDMNRYLDSVNDPEIAFNIKSLARLVSDKTGIKVVWR